MSGSLDMKSNLEKGECDAPLQTLSLPVPLSLFPLFPQPFISTIDISAIGIKFRFICFAFLRAAPGTEDAQRGCHPCHILSFVGGDRDLTP